MSLFYPRFAALLAAAAAVAGCSDLGSPLKLQPRSLLSATSIDFGTVALSQSATRSLTVTNSGTGRLRGAASLSCARYAIVAGGGPFALPPGESRTIVLAYTPAAVGSDSCALVLGPDCPSVALSGSGALQAPGARAVLLQDSIPFGPVAVGQSVAASFDVLDAGTDTLLVDVVSPCGDFQVASGGGVSQIPPGGSIHVTIAYRPGSSGRTSCALAVGPACPDVAVSGIGITASFARDVQPILVNHCGSCHDFGEPQFFDTYSLLVTQYLGSPTGRIKPFDLADSDLYNRVLTGIMPLGGPPLPADQVDTIRRWILEGASNN